MKTPNGGDSYFKGARYQRRQLPRRLASVATALTLWGAIGWWAVGGGRRIARLGVASGHPWLPSMTFAATAPLVWFRGNAIMDRALRTLPRLLYKLQVDHWKLLVVDIVSRPLSRLTAVALTVIMVNLSLLHAPSGVKFAIPQLFYADSEEASAAATVDACALTEIVFPLSRRALRALAISTLAYVALKLRHPPSFLGSRSFRLVPLRRRGDRPNASLKVPCGLEASPSLVLYSEGERVEMPAPAEGLDGTVPVWTFADYLAIDEYSWETAKSALPDADPVEWRLEALRGDGEDIRWHGIHETDVPMSDYVPLERGAPLLKRYIAPHGEVPRGERSLLGRYYRALQKPREDRDACAVALLVQSLVVVPLVLLGSLPWLSVFGVELASVVGMTSVGGVAAGAALSLAKSEVLENLFAGTLLSAQGTIVNGDDVEIRYQVGNSQQSLSGTVVRIGSAYVTLSDEEGQQVQIPNRRVLGSIIRSRRTPVPPATPEPVRMTSRDRISTSLNYLARRS